MTHVDQADHLEAVVVRKTLSWATVIGAVLGASAGSYLFPGVGTVIGAIVGAGVGLILGIVNVPVLMIAGRARRQWWGSVGSGVVSGATTFILGLDLELAIRAPFAIVCTLVAALAAPGVLWSSEEVVARELAASRALIDGRSRDTPDSQDRRR